MDAMKDWRMICSGERGFVLITAMVILVLLSIIGIATTRTANIELLIAGNDRRIKHAFYKADGGTEAGIELLEQNFSCPNGFSTAAGFDNNDAGTFFSIAGVDIFDAQFATDDAIRDLAGGSAGLSVTDIPSDSVRSIRIPDNPANRVDTEYHTNVAVYGRSGFAEGSAIQMAAGDKSKGYGSANGGGIKRKNLIAEYDGAANTVGKIRLDYVHLISDEGECIY